MPDGFSQLSRHGTSFFCRTADETGGKEALTFDVETDLDRPDDAPFDELERGFFAAAPPDVAEPAPEPMRFDDLDPIAPARPEPRAFVRRARNVTSSARGALRSFAGAATRRSLPVLTRATRWSAAAGRTTARAVTAAARVGARQARTQILRLIEMARNTPRERRLIAAGLAALLLVTGVSAVVVASRGNGRPTPAAVQPIASGAAGACEAPPALEPVTVATADAIPASLVGMEATPAPVISPPTRKRKQTQGPARQTVRATPPAAKPSAAKPSGYLPTNAANRPAFSR
jgi:hypothetical protein